MNIDELRQRAGVRRGKKARDERFHKRVEREDQKDQHRGEQVDDPEREALRF